MVRAMKWTVLLVACGSADAPAELAPVPRFDLGSCSLEVTSNVIASTTPPSTFTELAPGGDAAAQLSYWGDKLGTKEGLVIRCAGAKTSVTFTAREQSRASLPPGPNKYAISPVDRIVEVAGRLEQARFSMTDGTFEITALDDTHVAGTFELRTVFSHERSRVSGKVKGRFDFKCPRPRCQR